MLDVQNDSAMLIPLDFLRLNLLLWKLSGKALLTNLSEVTFPTGKDISVEVPWVNIILPLQ